MPKGTNGRIRGITAGREHVYERLKTSMGKTRAAKIANAGRTHVQRVRMARKAARTRARRAK